MSSSITTVRGELTSDDYRDFAARVADDRAFRSGQNALGGAAPRQVALNRAVITGTHHSFSHTLDSWTPVHQYETGRCWIFAALNLFRVDAARKMNLKQFEFSQGYVLFWDKIERSNFVLQTFIDTALERDDDDRTLAFIYGEPIQDAGQWDMLVNVVERHGLVPKVLMPDTWSGANTRQMNDAVAHQLRYGGKRLRELRRAGHSLDEVDAFKLEIMANIYRILSMCLGDPPAEFAWQWTDRDGQFRRDPLRTPVEFFRAYVDLPLQEYVCLVNDPRNAYGQTYVVDHLNNLVGGAPVKYLNVEIETLQRIAMDTIVGGEPVWFGCDASKMSHNERGLRHEDLFDLETLFGVPFPLSREDRLRVGASQMTHAMLLTGVDVVEGAPRRWRIEDSYGPTPGDGGFQVMSNGWFSEYVYEIAARKDRLPADLQAALLLEPAVLPIWDPMGALAR